MEKVLFAPTDVHCRWNITFYQMIGVSASDTLSIFFLSKKI